VFPTRCKMKIWGRTEVLTASLAALASNTKIAVPVASPLSY